MSVRTAPGDPALTDAVWRDVAQSMGESMGWADRPWVVVRHGEDHVHIVVSRVGFDGSLRHARHDFRSAQQARTAVEVELGLTQAPVRSQGVAPPLTRGEVAAGLRTGEAPARAVLAERVTAVVQASQGLGRETFDQALGEAGVVGRANVASTGRVSGYSFALEAYRDEAGELVWFKGSALGRDLSWSRMGPVVETPTKAMETVPVVEVARKRFELPGRHQVRVQAAQEAEMVRRVATAKREAPRVAGRKAGHRTRQIRQRWAVRAQSSPRVLVPARRAALAQAQKLHAASFPTPLKTTRPAPVQPPMKGLTLRQRAAALKATQDAAPARAVQARDVTRGPGRDSGGRGR